MFPFKLTSVSSRCAGNYNPLVISVILKRAVKADRDRAGAHKHKACKLIGGLNPGTVRVSTDNSKDAVILSRCAITKPATALFRIIALDRF